MVEVVVVNVALAIHWLNGVKTLPLVEHGKRTNGEPESDHGWKKTKSPLNKLAGNGATMIGRISSPNTAVNALAGLNNNHSMACFSKALELNGNGAAPSSCLLSELSLDHPSGQQPSAYGTLSASLEQLIWP